MGEIFKPELLTSGRAADWTVKHISVKPNRASGLQPAAIFVCFVDVDHKF